MNINFDSLHRMLAKLLEIKTQIDLTAAEVASDLGGQFSGIIGLNETGQIHGRAIKHDPASAQEVLRQYSTQVG